ncbi:hypothetical protein [Syntrophomonas wolfei]|uniref:hypothetical protein n=1 Tax=Syntrophomonas wolfei TaxID=863 RepID=UPI00059C29A7|nr:hypothetical protein [Syntrophomonas wolfei]
MKLLRSFFRCLKKVIYVNTSRVLWFVTPDGGLVKAGLEGHQEAEALEVFRKNFTNLWDSVCGEEVEISIVWEG